MNRIQKLGRMIVASSIGVALLPFSALAAYTDGMVIPAGTTAAVTGSINSYFFPTIMATAFQAQVIDLVLIVAAVMVAWFIIRSVWHRIKMHH